MIHNRLFLITLCFSNPDKILLLSAQDVSCLTATHPLSGHSPIWVPFLDVSHLRLSLYHTEPTSNKYMTYQCYINSLIILIPAFLSNKLLGSSSFRLKSGSFDINLSVCYLKHSSLYDLLCPIQYCHQVASNLLYAHSLKHKCSNDLFESSNQHLP